VTFDSRTRPSPLVADASRPLAAGRYARLDFEPPIAFEVPAWQAGQWAAVQSVEGFFDIQQGMGTPDVIALQFARPTGVEHAPEAAAVVAARRGLTVVETSAVTMAGLAGVGMTVDHAAGGDDFRPVFDVAAGPISIGPGRRLWVGWFDVAGGVLAVLIGGSVAQWAAAVTAAQPILASVVVGAGTSTT